MSQNHNEQMMGFWAHLNELRKRLIWSVIALAVGFAAAYGFSEKIFRLLMHPFDDAYMKTYGKPATMITTGLLESFIVYIKVGVLGGVFFASPFIFAQIWKFISPALHPHERRHAASIIISATVFFIGGALFGYFGVFPVGFRFFLSITEHEPIQPMIRMREYFEFASWMMIVFGLVFEAPLIVMYLTILGILKTHHLVRPWRGIIVAIAIASAMLTPGPDPGSMILMMIPLLVLYLATIIVSVFLGMRKPKSTPTA